MTCCVAFLARLRHLSIRLSGRVLFLHITTLHFAMNNMEFEQRCNALRLDLKTWEKKFSAANDGRKAGREDIKADATICMHARISLTTALTTV